jgi:hypothetical protein
MTLFGSVILLVDNNNSRRIRQQRQAVKCRGIYPRTFLHLLSTAPREVAFFKYSSL